MGRQFHLSLLVLSLLGLLLLQTAAAVRGPISFLRGGWAGETRSPLPRAEECGPQLSIETPSCSVVDVRDGYELRRYPPGQIWVSTVVANSSFGVSTTVGFYRCFNFISGQNADEEEIEMTGPVLIKPVPEAEGYSISFFAPSRFSSTDDLPKPNDPLVKFVETKEMLSAVLGPFGGFPMAKMYNYKWLELKALLDKDGVSYDESSVIYAGYSSPFEIFNRKQEVHVTLT